MARARGESRRRVLALIFVLAIAIPIGAASALQAAGSKPAAGESRALARLLRFKELPLGYRLLSFGPSPEYPAQSLTCSAIDPANPQPDLAAFLRRYSPWGCYAIYYRSFHVPGTKPAALAVGSGVMLMDNIESAEAGLAVAPELLSHLIGDELPEEVEPAATIGDATRLFHWRHPGLFKARERPSASFLIWRSGAAVAAVFATDGAVGTNDRTVLELAQLQQRRIESPIRVRASDFDSSEVALEDPALDIPVFWLGHRFAPGGGLQRLRLEDSGSSAADSLAPRISLVYIDHPRLHRAETVFLNFWSRKQWKRLEAKRRRLPAVPSCPTAQPLRIASKRLVIYKGFDVEHKGCGDNRARRARYTAQINLDGVVATAETSMTCAVCASAGTGPYDSRAGMEAIARGLVQRQPAGR